MPQAEVQSQPGGAPDVPDRAPARRLVAYAFGPFHLDLARRQLSKDGTPISLTPKAFDVLVALIRHRDRVFTKEELFATVWPNAFVTEDSLTQNIWALRRALGDDKAQPAYIATIPRTGYRFVAEVLEVEGRDGDVAPSNGAAAAGALHQVGTVAPVAPMAVPVRWTAVAGVLAAAAVLGAFLLGRATTPDATAEPGSVPVSFVQGPPEGNVLLPGVAVSPDGRSLAFVAQSITTRRSLIWIRDVATGAVHPVAGTNGGEQPFWSPRSNALGFFADGQLKTIALSGGTPTTIATVGVLPQGGTWGANDTILFASWISGLWSVPAAGGPYTPLTTVHGPAAEIAHRRPQFLPDAKHYVFSVESESEEAAGTYLGTIGSTERVKLFDDTVTAVQVAGNRLIGLRGATLIELRFNDAGDGVTGEPRKIDGPEIPAGFQPRAGFTASPAGLLAFGGGSGRERMVVYSADGKIERVLNSRPTRNPMLSPRGDQLVATGQDAQAGVWLVDLDRDVSTRVLATGIIPIWSPDGSTIAYASSGELGTRDLFVRSVTGDPEERLLLHTDEPKVVNDWTRDGKYIVYASVNPRLRVDLWLLPMFGDRKPIPYLQSEATQIQAQVSPDGRWVAYSSDESGQWEVYLQSFPTPGMKRIVSVGGGGEPHWSEDGEQLFYMRADKTLMSVDVRPDAPSNILGPSRALFTVPVVGDTTSFRRRYVVDSKAGRFLVNTIDESQQVPITVIANWADFGR